MDGLSPIEFEVSTPLSDEVCLEHIQHALSLGLPEIDINDRRLNIVANGPSARGFFKEKRDGDSMALNGALGLFLEYDRVPTYWAACDPQAELADFLRVAPKLTKYIVASKCHPGVFERLRNHDVRLWHINDAEIPGKRRVPCAVSITICAMQLAHRLGYHYIDMWGWDCCFSGKTLEEVGDHHAGKGDLSTTPQAIEIEIEGVEERYISNPTWACEFNDAQGVLPVLRWCGAEIAIHGRSLVSAIIPEFAAKEKELEEIEG